MADPLTTQIGSAIVPVPAGSAAGSVLPIADPALYGLLDAFKSYLCTTLDAAWQAATTPTDVGAAQVFNTHACEEAYAVELGLDLSKRQWRWPVLCLWRESEKYYQRTQVWDTRESVVRGVYTLPPLTREFYDRLAALRVPAMQSLRALIEHHGSPAYTPPGGHAGDDILAAFGIEEIWLLDVEYGSYGAGEGSLQAEHPAVRFRLQLKERGMPNYTTIYQPLTRTDDTIQLADSTGDLTILQTHYTPSPP